MGWASYLEDVSLRAAESGGVGFVSAGRMHRRWKKQDAHGCWKRSDVPR